MLYTGNVNKFIFWILIPLIVLSFLTFRLLEWRYLDDGGRLNIINQHKLNLNNHSNLNCVILGGSNAVFGLSAEMMTSHSSLNCYNLSLLNEGYSFRGYWDYIRSLPIKFKDIEYVFYSSVVPYRSKTHLDYMYQNGINKIGVSGDRSFKLLGESITSHFIRYLQNGSLPFDGSQSLKFPLPSFFGDFQFLEFEGCKSIIEIESEQNEDFKSLERWSDSQLLEMISIFPYSKRFFLLPAEFRDEKFDSTLQIEMLKSIKKIVSSHNSSYLIDEPQIYDSSLLCNAKHHPNSKGREIRTSNLISFFEKY